MLLIAMIKQWALLSKKKSGTTAMTDIYIDSHLYTDTTNVKMLHTDAIFRMKI
jgi:hypothetical protein